MSASPTERGRYHAAARAAALGRFVMPRVIETRRLTLAPLAVHDYGAFVRFWSDAASARHMGGATDGRGAWRRLTMLSGIWSLYGFGVYALRTRTGAFVGFGGLWFPHERDEIEILYAVMPEARGQGYAREAVAAVRSVAAAQGAPSLVSYIAVDNAPSLAVAEAVGAAREPLTLDFGGTTVAVLRHRTASGAAIAGEAPEDDGILLETSAMPLMIRTERLTLSQWRPDHFAAFSALAADGSCARILGAGRTAAEAWRAMAASAGHWLMRGYGLYALEADGRLAGAVGLVAPPGTAEIELAWALAPHARGRGYAQEAARAVRAVAAAQGLSRLVSLVDADDAASQALARRLRAQPEAAGATGVIRFSHPMAQEAGHARAAAS